MLQIWLLICSLRKWFVTFNYVEHVAGVGPLYSWVLFTLWWSYSLTILGIMFMASVCQSPIVLRTWNIRYLVSIYILLDWIFNNGACIMGVCYPHLLQAVRARCFALNLSCRVKLKCFIVFGIPFAQQTIQTWQRMSDWAVLLRVQKRERQLARYAILIANLSLTSCSKYFHFLLSAVSMKRSELHVREVSICLCRFRYVVQVVALKYSLYSHK